MIAASGPVILPKHLPPRLRGASPLPRMLSLPIGSTPAEAEHAFRAGAPQRERPPDPESDPLRASRVLRARKARRSCPRGGRRSDSSGEERGIEQASGREARDRPAGPLRERVGGRAPDQLVLEDLNTLAPRLALEAVGGRVD